MATNGAINLDGLVKIKPLQDQRSKFLKLKHHFTTVCQLLLYRRTQGTQLYMKLIFLALDALGNSTTILIL